MALAQWRRTTRVDPESTKAHWQIDWQGTSAGAPVAGQQALALPASTTLAVGELQALVTGGEQ